MTGVCRPATGKSRWRPGTSGTIKKADQGLPPGRKRHRYPQGHGSDQLRL